MKAIPQDKTVCKACKTPNICKDMGAFDSCRLQPKPTWILTKMIYRVKSFERNLTGM